MPTPIPADVLPEGRRNPVEHVLAHLGTGAPLLPLLAPALNLVAQRIVDTAVLSAREKRTLALVP